MKIKSDKALTQKSVLILGNYDVGIYNFRLELVKRLLSNGHRVCISAPNGERTEALKTLGVNYIDTKVSRHGMSVREDYALLRAYRKIIRQVQPDVVFTYTIKPNIYGAMACAKSSIPCIANITGLGTALENGGALQTILLFMYKFAFRRIQRVFFQNKENMAFFETHRIALGKHALLPGSGVNLKRFSPLPYPNDTTVEFAFISRIMQEKGIDQYLDAAKAIREKHPNTRFHVCGFCEQEYEETLQELDKAGVIVYHGMVRDIREVLKTVHCTVHPTYYPEGLSNVLLESCACARPIITTDRSGCKEVIDDGINGWIVRQKDSADLITQIEKFIALPSEMKAAMGLAGRKKVEAEFDRQIVVDAYCKELAV